MKGRKGFTKLGTIKRKIRESIDLDFYDLMWALCLFMAGDKATIDRAINGKILNESNRRGDMGGDLPDYGDIMPGIGQVGTQNHSLVNARIMIEGLSMEPELTFAHPDPLIRAVNQAYIRDLWVSQGWDEPMMMSGMEVEATGIGGFHWGVTDDRPGGRHQSLFDTVWDGANKEPGKWGWVCVRRRLDPDEAKDIYDGVLTDAEWEALETKERPDPRSGSDIRESEHRPRRCVIVEWAWYSKDEHVVFLGGTQSATNIALKLNDQYEYVKAGTNAEPNRDDATAGPNPFGCIPHSFWTDGWTPAVKRPASKTETGIRLCAMLSEVERFIVTTLRRGVVRTAVDASLIDEDLHNKLKSINSFEALEDIILINGGNIKDVLSRTDPIRLDETAIYLRSMLKEELNAVTGVGDMQRGQAVGGERRTRFEISALLDQSGVKARHVRRRFAVFLRDSVNIIRTIGAQHDHAARTLSLEDMEPLDMSLFPIAPFLSLDLPCEVNPASLVFKTDEDRRQEAIIDLQQVHTPFMEMGVADPQKVYAETLKRMGEPNGIKKYGFTPQQIAQRQMEQQQTEMAQQTATTG